MKHRSTIHSRSASSRFRWRRSFMSGPPGEEDPKRGPERLDRFSTTCRRAEKWRSGRCDFRIQSRARTSRWAAIAAICFTALNTYPDILINKPSATKPHLPSLAVAIRPSVRPAQYDVLPASATFLHSPSRSHYADAENPGLRRIVLVLSACAPAAPPSVDTAADEAALKAATLTWLEAHNAGDVEKIVALYEEGAVLMPPHAPVANGHAAIRAFLTADTAGAKAAASRSFLARPPLASPATPAGNRGPTPPQTRRASS